MKMLTLTVNQLNDKGESLGLSPAKVGFGEIQLAIKPHCQTLVFKLKNKNNDVLNTNKVRLYHDDNDYRG